MNDLGWHPSLRPGASRYAHTSGLSIRSLRLQALRQ